MDLFAFFDTIYPISAKAKEALKQLIREQRHAKNEIVQGIGSRCRTVYLVKTGGARIFYYKDGNDITEHFAFENELIVRAESLFTGNPTSKGIQAIDDTTLLAIDSEKLFQLYDQHHDLERLFRLIFEREYVHTVKRLESLQFKSARERYLELLETTDFVQKIPLKYIASYLGITQVSLSRIRSSLG
ncbi:cAMP-binding domain of CRP or a regulatory subunit of cAMP-dependent protein kinases [Cyclobacterium xiamenense]|uniref:cAMP-binding domain of CRP or a regulatory subunit of cAMP-dependent protein kinases n=1 Tax=Cyclobacterium xiamenense TaxID=1297121 RepID=A0A1H6VY44_9BACT|nr:cAMP-binding domain of CRP or a regulatory subunit of cAMP-dependent protein kinases [Cyclobacterium xiamenense]